MTATAIEGAVIEGAVIEGAAIEGVGIGRAALDAVVEPVLEAVRENAATADEDAVFPEAALKSFRDSGLLGLMVPAAYGGLDGDVADLVGVSGRIAREDTSAALIFAMHCQQAMAVAHHGAAPLRSSLLPRIASGEVYLASVTTEYGKGGHLLTSDAVLTADGGRFGIERSAPIVTGAAYADGFLITMRAPGAESPAQVSLVYADRAQLEVAATGSWAPMGMRASHSLPVRLDGSIPADQVVGEHGGFRDIAVRLFAPVAHIGWSACWLGAAAGALSRTVKYLRGEEGRRSHDLSSELLLCRLGRVRGRLDGVHASLMRCVELIGDGRDVSHPRNQLLLNTLKITASEQCFAAVDELVELVGLRHGYMRSSPLWLERVLRDLRAASLNYSNDRLVLADGRLALMDPEVCFA